MKPKKSAQVYWFLLGAGLFFLILVGRLYYLQVLKGEQFRLRSESNFIQERVISHSRGKILDSAGDILVDNRLSYDLYITFALLPDSRKALRILNNTLQISNKSLRYIDEEIVKRARYNLSGPVPLLEEATHHTCARLQEHARANLIGGLQISYYQVQQNLQCLVEINPIEFPTNILVFKRLLNLLPNNKNKFNELWQRAAGKSRGLARFRPVLLIADIGYDSYAKIENQISLGQLAGVSVIGSKRRRYIHGDMATHVIGFVNQVSLKELKKNHTSYRSGDAIGRSGIEATMESELRGRDGLERVVVDAKGRRFEQTWEDSLLGPYKNLDPRSGNTVQVSIDSDMQRAAQDLFSGRSGSVVVMEVKTGFIRALASFPSFDPNKIVSAHNYQALKDLRQNTLRPFRNKAIQDHFSPGSTFKPFTAVAGLVNNIITKNHETTCTGKFRIHKTQWRCFRRWGHGLINLHEALKVSCDNYFYELGQKLGLANLAQVSHNFGFGARTGINLLGESQGIVPDRKYYQKRFGYVAPGFVVNMAIGQGDLSVTPLQLVSAYSALANNGIIYEPQLVEAIYDSNNKLLKRFKPKIIKTITPEKFSFAEIREDLSHVTSRGGSASGIHYKPEFADISKWIKKNNIKIIGKTGTAQVVKLDQNIHHLDPEEVEYQLRDHAWFVGIFPKDDPSIAVGVMTEHGGFGASTSAPVAIRIMKKYYEKLSKPGGVS